MDRASSWYLNKGRPTRWHLLYYLLLNMFQTLIRPPSVVQPALGYHITNSQSRYITPTRLKSAQYSLHNNAPSSRKLLKMDVLTSETCWAVNWHNKASDIKLVYLYSKKLKFYARHSHGVFVADTSLLGCHAVSTGKNRRFYDTTIFRNVAVIYPAIHNNNNPQELNLQFCFHCLVTRHELPTLYTHFRNCLLFVSLAFWQFWTRYAIMNTVRNLEPRGNQNCHPNFSTHHNDLFRKTYVTKHPKFP